MDFFFWRSNLTSNDDVIFGYVGLNTGTDCSPHQEFQGIDLRPGFLRHISSGVSNLSRYSLVSTTCSDVTSHAVTLTFSEQVASRTTNEQQNYFYDFYLHKCIDFTLYRLTVFICGTV